MKFDSVSFDHIYIVEVGEKMEVSVWFTRLEFVRVSEALSGAPSIHRRSEAGDEDSGDGTSGGGDGAPGTGGGATGGGGV